MGRRDEFSIPDGRSPSGLGQGQSPGEWNDPGRNVAETGHVGIVTGSLADASVSDALDALNFLLVTLLSVRLIHQRHPRHWSALDADRRRAYYDRQAVFSA